MSSCTISALDLFSVGIIVPLITSITKPPFGQISLLPFLAYDVPLNFFLITIGFLFILKNSLTWWFFHRQSLFVHDTFVKMSESIYRDFFKQSFEDYCLQNSAENIRRIKHAPSDFTNHVLLPLLQLVTDLIVVTCVVLFLFWYDYKIMIALACAMLPFLIMYYVFKGTIVSKINKIFREQTPIGNVLIAKGIDAFAEAKLYKKENFFVQRFMSVNALTSRHLANLRTSSMLPSKIYEVLAIACLCVILFYSQHLNSSKTLLLTGIVLLAFYKLGPALNRLLISLTEIEAYAYTIGLIQKPFSRVNSQAHSLNEKILCFKEAIVVEDISFRYAAASTNTLDGVNLVINRSDFFVLDGPSGIGKSTLLNSLNGFLPVQNGGIIVDGIRISSANISNWQSLIGYVPQNGVIMDDTILANIAFGEHVHTANINKVKEVIELAGLSAFTSQLKDGIYHPIGENGLTISGGQRQRLLLARALYRDPQVLIIDEVTNHLDYDSKIKILETLRDMSKRGLTIIAATHDPIVKNYANRTFSLSETERKSALSAKPF